MQLELDPQVLHAAVALDPVARSAQQLQVVDMVGAAAGPRDDVVHFQVASLEVLTATGAITRLDPIQRLPMCARRWQLSEVRSLRGICADRHVSMVEHGADAERRLFPEPPIYQIGGPLAEMSMPTHWRSKTSAAMHVVAHPQKGSSTTSPALLLASMIR